LKLFSLALLLMVHFSASGQKAIWDSLNVQYDIVHIECHPGYDLIKIKVPPYLSSQEVMKQVRLVLFWPGASPPRKKTKVYVFKETALYGTKSHTGGVYFPGHGIKWDMVDWSPDSSLIQKPSPREINIYNSLLDSLFKEGLQFSEIDHRHAIARRMKIAPAKLDSIYFRVKFWHNLHPGRR